MRCSKPLFLSCAILALSTVASKADVNVVTSIKPVHSLVSAVMEGVGEPGLIVDGAGSPHSFALKPSQARALQGADVVFWVGQEMETFLKGPIGTVAEKANSVELMDSHDLIKLKFREGGAFDKHAHDDHGHDDDDHDEHEKDGHEDHDDHEKHADHDDHEKHDHDDHERDDHEKKEHEKHADHEEHDHDKDGHEKHDEHDHEKEKAAEADHDGHDDHKDHDDHEGHDDHAFDGHIWLDPVNAKAMVHEIEEALAEADPENAARYEANAEAVSAKLDDLVKEIAADLKPVHDKGFIVFHDAYQYFEKRFDITASGSITVTPDVMPGAERITEIRGRVQQTGASCVFAEPQFEPKLVATITEGTTAKSGVIDPLGSRIDAGPDQYFQLIRNMATSIKTCLGEAS